ncbi:MAG: FAD-dependent oxidoreductase [Burkholderiales bacterium]
MPKPDRASKQLLLVGGGHSHVAVLRSLGERPLPGVSATLISPERFTPYSGMLPGLIAGHYEYRECHIDLAALARFACCTHVEEAVTHLDLARQVASIAGGGEHGWDVISLDIGSNPDTTGVPGARECAIAVKPVHRLLAALPELVARARQGVLRRILFVGGGAAGVEVLLALQHHLFAVGVRGVEMILATDADVPLVAHNARVRAIFSRVLADRRVRVHVRSRIVRVDPDAALTDTGERIGFDALIWATGAAAAAWPGESGLAVDPNGFVLVDETLQSVSHAHVFAAGDIATMRGHPRPKSGVYAVRHGPPLARNIRRALAGERLAPFVPQGEALALISTGDRYAVMSRGRWALKGAWVWRWKDWIDRRFMRRYAV